MAQDSTIPNLVLGVGMLSTDIVLIIKDPFGVPQPVYMTLAQLVTAGGGGGGGGLSGVGSPEGATVGSVGQVYTDITDTAHPALYVKTTGAGNTGWVFFLQVA